MYMFTLDENEINFNGCEISFKTQLLECVNKTIYNVFTNRLTIFEKDML